MNPIDKLIEDEGLTMAKLFHMKSKVQGVVLRTKAEPFLTSELEAGSENQLAIQSAIDFVSKEENSAAGLAAHQVGLSQAWFVMKIGREQEVIVVANPDILGRSGRKQYVEGCFSETYDAQVKRSCDITVNCELLTFDSDGNVYVEQKKFWKLDKRDAQVFQHEYHHLQGKLICDIGKVIYDK